MQGKIYRISFPLISIIILYDIFQGFFKRAISNRRIYRCVNGDEQCQMSRKDRNRCQFCRLKKCLHVGMNRKGKDLYIS